MNEHKEKSNLGKLPSVLVLFLLAGVILMVLFGVYYLKLAWWIAVAGVVLALVLHGLFLT